MSRPLCIHRVWKRTSDTRGCRCPGPIWERSSTWRRRRAPNRPWSFRCRSSIPPSRSRSPERRPARPAPESVFAPEQLSDGGLSRRLEVPGVPGAATCRPAGVHFGGGACGLSLALFERVPELRWLLRGDLFRWRLRSFGRHPHRLASLNAGRTFAEIVRGAAGPPGVVGPPRRLRLMRPAQHPGISDRPRMFRCPGWVAAAPLGPGVVPTAGVVPTGRRSRGALLPDLAEVLLHRLGVTLDVAGQGLKELPFPGQEPAHGLRDLGCLTRRGRGLAAALCPSGSGYCPRLRSGLGQDAGGVLPGSPDDLIRLGRPGHLDRSGSLQLHLFAQALVLRVEPGNLLGELIEEPVDVPLVVSAEGQAELALLDVDRGDPPLLRAGGRLRLILRILRSSCHVTSRSQLA